VEKVIECIGLWKEGAFSRARWRNGMKLNHGRKEENLVMPV